MTDLRTAAKQALEALEWFTASEPGDEPPINAAITALRAALAEPVQEPVAWRYDLKRGGSFAGVSIEYSRVKLSIGENWTPLYAAPPQRKPLTSLHNASGAGHDRPT